VQDLDLLRKLKKDRRLYFRKCLKIRDKNSNIVAFIPNDAQEQLIKIIEDWEQKYPDSKTRPTLYIIILKARQLGFSTATEGIFFHDIQFAFNKVAMVISYDADSASTISDMSNRFYQYLPQAIKPGRRKAVGKGIMLENPNFDSSKPTSDKNDPGLQSKFLIETANNMNAGSSYTINFLHISELAKWDNPEQTMTSIMQAVPDKNAIVIVESTAKGMNYFSDLWDSAVSGRNNYVRIFVSWHENPEYVASYKGFVLTEYEEEIKGLYNLSLEQLQWRRNTIEDKLNGDESLFKQEYPSCPEEAFLLSGTPVFDNEIVLSRYKKLEKYYEEHPPMVGRLHYDYENQMIVDSSIEFVPDKNGPLIIYDMPKEGYPYVIGGDIAEGGIDYSTGEVINNVTGEQVAAWRDHTNTDLYAKQMYCLGRLYNTALIAIEDNYDKHPVKELQRLEYPSQYIKESLDKIGEDTQKKYGWTTGSVNRPLLVGNLVTIVRESPELINDLETLREMLTFAKDKNGRPAAIANKHDDTVLGLGIAHKVRHQQKSTVKLQKEQKTPVQLHKERLFKQSKHKRRIM
jgi:hypothetical protein